MFEPTDFWIVRCPPAKTLQLLVELIELGFEGWTPVVEREYRKARSKRFTKVREPMLSSFIFIEMGDAPHQCAERLDDLRWMLGIRVMRDTGSFAAVKAEQLKGLRAIEREAATFGIDNLVKQDQFEIGQQGTINSASFLGLTCTLVDRTKNNLLVLLEGSNNPISVKAALFCPNDMRAK